MPRPRHTDLDLQTPGHPRCLPANLQSPAGPSSLRLCLLSWLSSPCALGPLLPPCSVSSLSSHPRVLGSAPPPLSLHSLFPGHFISLHGFSPLMTNTHVHRPINISPRHPTPEPHEVQGCTGIVREVKLLTEALLRASSGLPRCVSWHAHPKPTRWVRCPPSDQWRGHASESRWTSGSQLMQAELGFRPGFLNAKPQGISAPTPCLNSS